MRKSRVAITGFVASLLLLFAIGCGQESVSIPDTTPPLVVSTTPAPGATGVGIGATISATFSKPMNAATITASSFSVAGPGGTAVAGNIAYSSSGSVATFTPTANLAARHAL
jgi:hypothetical protein